MEKIAGFFSPFIVYIIIFLLNLVLPGRWVTGYVTRPGTAEKLRYRLNGLLVMIVLLAGWTLLCYRNIIAWDWFYRFRWYALAGGVTVGFLFSVMIVMPYPAVKKSMLADFYFGRAENIQLWNRPQQCCPNSVFRPQDCFDIVQQRGTIISAACDKRHGCMAIEIDDSTRSRPACLQTGR